MVKIHSLNLELCFLGALVLSFQKGLDFPGGSVGKNSPTNAGDTGSSPGPGRSLGEGNGNPLQYFAWGIPWTEELGGLQSTGCKESDTTERLHFHFSFTL